MLIGGEKGYLHRPRGGEGKGGEGELYNVVAIAITIAIPVRVNLDNSIPLNFHGQPDQRKSGRSQRRGVIRFHQSKP